jgi:hypothetical protein
MSGNDNPGNFANRSKEEVSKLGRKGGQASHSGGFASMDPQKQVYIYPPESPPPPPGAGAKPPTFIRAGAFVFPQILIVA